MSGKNLKKETGFHVHQINYLIYSLTYSTKQKHFSSGNFQSNLSSIRNIMVLFLSFRQNPPAYIYIYILILMLFRWEKKVNIFKWIGPQVDLFSKLFIFLLHVSSVYTFIRKIIMKHYNLPDVRVNTGNTRICT